MAKIPEPREFAKKQKYKAKPTAFSTRDPVAGNDRTKDTVEDDHIAKLYTDTHIERLPDGTYKATCITDGKELVEYMHSSGTGYKITSEGSVDETNTGNKRTNTKGGSTSSIMEGSDSVTQGHTRFIGGTQKVNAGHHRETNGNETKFIAGIETTVSSQASGRSHNTLGKYIINAEGGIGMGVNKGSERKVYQRMEADGTYHLQVTPAGDTGGMATIKINPDGSVFVTSESTLDINVKGTMSIKAPLLTIDAPIETTSTIKSDGSHTASFYYGGGHSWPE